VRPTQYWPVTISTSTLHPTPIIRKQDHEIMKLTALVAPPAAATEFTTAVSPRQFDAVDEFVAAVEQAAGARVPVVEGSWADAPTDGFVLVFGARGLTNSPTPDVDRRVVLINADRSNVLQRLEERGLAAAIEKHRYYLWRTQRQHENGGGVFGRKEVAARLGATFSAGSFESKHYGLLSSEGYKDLPSLLVSYLVAYSEIQEDN
jgi:hypothetical protein